MRFGTLLLSALFLATAALPAQGSKSTYGPLGDHVIAGPGKTVDIITPHITDSHVIELPFGHEWELPRWAPIHVGSIAIDMSPTKHVIMLLIAALLCLGIMIPAAMSNERQTAHKGHAKGFAGAIESLVLYLRNEVVLPNVGHHGEAFVPFATTLFFFILFANLLGLIPYGSTATGNISVTAMLAITAFVVIEVAGMRALGVGYWKTIVYWPSDQSIWIKLPMTFIMTPIEIIGKFTKPFALAIRLFANMTAGHVVLLALISLIFTFGSYYVAAAPIAMGVAISMLELFVALLQAYIFTLLASVFIGLIRESAH
ncbi:MAG: F0F1 ATP synthase subunit A [Gemmatimonadaceae bacterium]